MAVSTGGANVTGPELKTECRQRPRGSPRAILALTLVAIAAAGCWVVIKVHQPATVVRRSRDVRLLTLDRPFPAEGRFASDPYIGSAVCSECHPGEAALHSRSGHATTLRPPNRLAVARELDGITLADPELPAVRWTYRFRDGALHIARQTKDTVEDCIADYAFGSGRHAITFVNMIDAAIPAILEHRLTYFARSGRLGLTPGHDIKPPPPGLTLKGGVPPPRSTRACFDCHATQISAEGGPGIDESSMIPNVTCERCHGPGRSHVAAARRMAPESELSLPLGPGRWKAPELLRFCGTCHRHPSGPRPEQIRRGDPLLARFQPIGLSLSRCYRESAGAFSCVSCHDPHGRGSSKRVEYDTICVKCHRARSGPPQVAQRPAASATICPVSPRHGCVDCHMPLVEVSRDLILSDHWIRIHRNDEQRVRQTVGVPSERFPDLHEP
jgi:predicted CXXCH cytochrome family protein